MTDTSSSTRGRIGSLRYVAAAVLLGLSAGVAVAQGDSGGLYTYKTMQQVQSGNYATQINQNGEERFLGR